MASKKIKKALGAALVGFGAAKAMSAMGAAKKAKIAAAQVDTGDLGSEMANDTALASAMRKNMEAGVAAKKAAANNSLWGKTKNFLKSEVFTTDPKTKAFTIPKGPKSSENFGLGMYDMNKGGILKAKNGVMARGCKLGKNKRTIIT